MPEPHDISALDRAPDRTARSRFQGRPLPYHLLLLPGVPVLALWSGNASALRSLYPLRLMVTSVVLALVATLIAAVVQRDIRRSALVGGMSVVAASSLGYVLRDPTRAGLNMAAMVILIAGLAILSTKLSEPSIRNATLVLNVIGLALMMANGAVVLRDRPEGRVKHADADVQRDQVDGRDVWYLVPDRYPAAPVLEGVGVDVDPFIRELEHRGFEVLPDVRANYPQTLLSLGSAWGLDYLGTTDLDISESAEASLRLADPLLGQLFDTAGYDYIHLGSWPEFTASSRSADVVATLQGASEFYTAYEPTTILPTIRFLMDVGTPVTLEQTRQLAHGQHQLEVLAGLAGAESPTPQFVLSHLVLPHGPYVFKADGSPRDPGSVTPAGALDAYEDQVTYLNRQLVSLIDNLQEREEPPIIVILADEGLYPEDLIGGETDDTDPGSYSVEEIDRKLSVFAAIYDPTRDFPDEFLRTPVNITRALANRTLGTDYGVLPDMSFRWADDSFSTLVRVPHVAPQEADS